MPDLITAYTGGGAPAPTSRPVRRGGSLVDVYRQTAAPIDETLPVIDVSPVDSEDTPVEDSGITPAAAAGGVLATGGVAWLLSKLKGAPGITGKVGKVADYVNTARQQAMLSGFALPKSMLGNVGAGVSASLEHGSLAPLKAMLSPQTLKDALTAYRVNAGPLRAGAKTPRGTTLPGPMPGRIMGAFDEAAQGALKRGGLTAAEAEREVLQAPLPPQLAEALDSPIAQYVHPFRRTPFNQFLEGLKTLRPEQMQRNRLATGTYLGTGALHGAATADDPTPLSLPLAMAGAGRYGYPYGAAAILARALAGGKASGTGIASGMLPVSEYGVEQSLTQPLKPFTKPAALTALERLAR